MFLHPDIHEKFEKPNGGETFTLRTRDLYHQEKAFRPQLCLRSVKRLFALSGGHALLDSVVLQHFHRDAHAVTDRDGLIRDLGGQQ